MYLGQLGNYIPMHEMKHGLKHSKYIFNPQRGVCFEIALPYPNMYLQGSRQITISFQEHDNKNI